MAACLWPARRRGVRAVLAMLRACLLGCWPSGRRMQVKGAPDATNQPDLRRFTPNKRARCAARLDWPIRRPPLPSPSRSEPATKAETGGSGGARRRLDSAPPAGPPVGASGAAAAAGRRQRRPSSRTFPAHEAQAEAAEAAERAGRRRGRQQRQAQRVLDGGGQSGSTGDEAGEVDETMEMPEEDPDWRPGQGQPRAGSMPVLKRSRRASAAPH